jgi:hypothetical protein
MTEGPRKRSSRLCNEGPEAADHLENKIVRFPLGKDVTTQKEFLGRVQDNSRRRLRPSGLLEPLVQRRFSSFLTSLPISMGLLLRLGQDKDKRNLFLPVSRPVPTSSAVSTDRRFETRRLASTSCWRDQSRETVHRTDPKTPVLTRSSARSPYEESRSCRENQVEMAAAGWRHSGRSTHRRNASR